jgi:uncharacterized protein YggE
MRSKAWLIVVLTAALLVIGMGAANIFRAPEVTFAADDATSEPDKLEVNGLGEVKAVPDLLVITLGVESRADQAVDAQTLNAAAMNKVMAALKLAGIAEKDMTTTRITLTQEFRWDDKQQRSVPADWVAQNMLMVKSRDLNAAGKLVDAAVNAGANRVNGISFQVEDPKALSREALEAAIADAREKAELMAKASGRKLGKVIYINEQGGYANPQPMYNYDMVGSARAAEAAPTPVMAGETTVSASVHMIFELD